MKIKLLNYLSRHQTTKNYRKYRDNSFSEKHRTSLARRWIPVSHGRKIASAEEGTLQALVVSGQPSRPRWLAEVSGLVCLLYYDGLPGPVARLVNLFNTLDYFLFCLFETKTFLGDKSFEPSFAVSDCTRCRTTCIN